MKMLVFAVTLVWLGGCSHSIHIISDPPGARVFINSNEVGRTPMSFQENTSPGSAHALTLKLEGYKDFDGTLVRTFDWVQGGLTCGIGALACGGINVATGGSGLGYLVFLPALGASVFSFKGPDQFKATLEPLPARAPSPATAPGPLALGAP